MFDGDLCPYFGSCGGCASQDVPYQTQLERKARALEELLRPWWPNAIELTPSPRVWNYRNKVELNFGRKRYPEPPPPGFARETVLGFKRRGKWFWTLDVEECRIGPDGLDESLLGGIRVWYRDARLQAHNARRGDGLLRYLLVRVGQRTGERMVMLITAPGELDGSGFLEAVHAVWPQASVLRGIHPGKADQAIAETVEVWHGSETIHEALDLDFGGAEPRRFAFRISPFSFFQTNTAATEKLYERVRAWVTETAPRVLYDFYGGSGGIAFSCADRVERVESVESWAPASEDGRHNARVNGVENVSFTSESVERYLGRLKVTRVGFEEDAAAVLDPPRSGLHPKALRRLGEIGPRHLLYVSCKPSALARELETLGDAYRVTHAEGVDLFPHTPHVEALVALERRP